MTYTMYAVRDVKVGFLSPMVEINEEVAKRNFYLGVSRSGSIEHFAPQDFQFYALGYYDTDSGCIDPFPAPVHIADAVDVYVGPEAKYDFYKEAEDS